MELRDITFSYEDGGVIFDHLTITVPDSGITALTGPSGCGKSTLLKIMAGILTPEEGTVPKLDGAILFQENRLLHGLTPRKQLKAVLPSDVSDDTILSFLEAVGLKEEADKQAGTLSGGMRRRVALARCLAFASIKGKEILFLDEPFAGVDGERSLMIMEQIRKMGIPAIMAVHGTNVQRQADHVITLSGR